MTRYLVTGKPLAPPLEGALAGCRVGDTINVTLDDKLEGALAAAGVIIRLPEPVAKPKPPAAKPGSGQRMRWR